jgi:hypothetical protein
MTVSINEPIKGRVAEILNSRELVINRGSKDGVTVGMKFAILEPKGENIVDPETEEPLGSVHRPKVEVRVESVQDRLAVAKTFRYRDRNVGGIGVGSSSLRLFEPAKFERIYDSFKSDQMTWEDIDETESYVKIGDPVEEVRDIAGEPAQAQRQTVRTTKRTQAGSG